MKALILITLIVGSTFIMLFLTIQMRLDGLTPDVFPLKIPPRQSNHTNMQVKKSDIPHWISCPQAVIQ